MTKDYFIELANYNFWANGIVCDWVKQINDEQWRMEIISSFNSIQETVLHIVSAEKAWLERFQGNQNFVWLQSVYEGSKNQHLALLKETGENMVNYVETFEETHLQTTLVFKRLNGEINAKPYYQLFAHVLNHSTYHRGQLVTMLRQAGFTNVGSTDLSLYYKDQYSPPVAE